jgi:hypothetical protein
MKKLIDELFVLIPENIISSHVFVECPPAALKILLAVANHWLRGGLKDNGNLMVTSAADRYRHQQLEALGMLIV